MKSLSVALLFCFFSSLVLAAEDSSYQLDRTALAECNATNPVQRNAVNVIDYSLLVGDVVNLSHEEKCFVFCFLQKVHFLDENANIKNGKGLVKFILEKVPQLVKYTDSVVSATWLVGRLYNGIQDKCEKAFVIYNQYATSLLTFAVAHVLEQNTHVKENVTNTLNSNGGQKFNEELPKEIAAFLKNYNQLLTSAGKYLLETANAGVENETKS